VGNWCRGQLHRIVDEQVVYKTARSQEKDRKQDGLAHPETRPFERRVAVSCCTYAPKVGGVQLTRAAVPRHTHACKIPSPWTSSRDLAAFQCAALLSAICSTARPFAASITRARVVSLSKGMTFRCRRGSYRGGQTQRRLVQLVQHRANERHGRRRERHRRRGAAQRGHLIAHVQFQRSASCAHCGSAPRQCVSSASAARQCAHCGSRASWRHSVACSSLRIK
jgi:hypothetical protein